MNSSARPRLIHPPAPQTDPADAQHERMWGFADSGFVASAAGIRMDSARYEVGGRVLPHLPEFVQRAIGVPFDAESRHEPVHSSTPASRASAALLEGLRRAVGEEHVSKDDAQRRRHGHGHHLEEIYEVLFGQLRRVPDVVVWPRGDAEIQQVLEVAQEHGARVSPFGGGTCVSMALSCPDDERLVVSLDLARNQRIEWIDPVSRTASIEAGAVGRVLAEQLEGHGFTLGHEPDSIEFSTLGGWIATNASGMKKNRYGNIEDIVLDVSVVTRQGVVEHPVVVPRCSHGLDVRRLALGSEGMLGVVSRATVKVHRLPELREYGSLIFPSFSRGLSFLEELSQWQLLPASVRLVDNLQLQFGRALKPAGKSALAAAAQRFLLTRVKRVSLEEIVACTLVYEGPKAEQRDLARRVKRLAARHGGFPGGAAAGKDGYNLTFGIAYIRDFLLQHWTLGDSFETAAPWGRVQEVIDAVKRSVEASHRELGLPGHAFVTSRISQLYQTGCCIYFYIGFHYRGVAEPLSAFRRIEHDARLAILEAGGALSHHHGIGKVRAPYLNRIKSETARDWISRTREALDPEGLFDFKNQGL